MLTRTTQIIYIYIYIYKAHNAAKYAQAPEAAMFVQGQRV